MTKTLLLTSALAITLIATKDMNVAAKTTTTSIAINAKNFPDNNFRKIVKQRFDKNKDGKLSKKEIDVVKAIDLDGTSKGNSTKEEFQAMKNIKSLRGLKYFTNLRDAYIDLPKLTELNFTAPKLTDVMIDCPELKTFSLSGGSYLKTIVLYNYKATDKLQLQKFKNLEELTIGAKRVIRYENLGVTKCKKLKSIVICNDYTTSKTGYVSANKIDLTVFPNIRGVLLEGKVKSVNATNLKKLAFLQVLNSGMTELKVKGCTNLTLISCPGSKLKELNVSGLKNLYAINCDETTKLVGGRKDIEVIYGDEILN